MTRKERRFCEAFLLAEAMKQKAAQDAQAEGQDPEKAKFDAQASSWAQEVRQRYGVSKA